MQTLVSFLTKRVRSPDEDDWANLRRGLMYLKGMLHVKLNITVDSLSSIRWYVYAVRGVYVPLNRGEAIYGNVQLHV